MGWLGCLSKADRLGYLQWDEVNSLKNNIGLLLRWMTTAPMSMLPPLLPTVPAPEPFAPLSQLCQLRMPGGTDEAPGLPRPPNLSSLSLPLPTQSAPHPLSALPTVHVWRH